MHIRAAARLAPQPAVDVWNAEIRAERRDSGGERYQRVVSAAIARAEVARHIAGKPCKRGRDRRAVAHPITLRWPSASEIATCATKKDGIEI